MIYVALLRAVNVGGTGTVSMERLKAVFESLGLESVRTYINSGNVLFRSRSSSPAALTSRIEAAIKKDTGLPVRVLLRDIDEMQRLVAAIPKGWVNDGQMKCDVMFLWQEVDKPATAKALPANPEIEDVKYVKGAILWRIDRSNAAKTRMTKIVGTPLHKSMTVRNPNTVRKLYDMMRALDSKK